MRAAPNPEAGLEGAQTLNLSIIKISYHPYDPHKIVAMHNRMTTDFGRLNVRWGFYIMHVETDYVKSMGLDIQYWFMDAKDATLFLLKHAPKNQFGQ